MNWDGQLGLGHKSNALHPEILSVFSSADQPCVLRAGAALNAAGAPVVGSDVAGGVAGAAGGVAGDESEGADALGDVEGFLGDGEGGQQQGWAAGFVPEISDLAAGSADVLSGSNRLSSTGFVVAVDRQGLVWSWVSFCHETLHLMTCPLHDVSLVDVFVCIDVYTYLCVLMCRLLTYLCVGFLW